MYKLKGTARVAFVAKRRGAFAQRQSKYGFTALLFIAFFSCKSRIDGSKLKLPAQPSQVASESQPAPAETVGAVPEAPSAPAVEPDQSAGGTAVVRLTGSTAPHRSSSVAVNGSGLLEQMLVREGEMIKVGQPIARLDRTDAELRVRQAQAALAGARVGLAAAQRERKRLERLDQGSAVSQAAIDQAQTAVEAAQSGVAAAEVALALAQDASRNRTAYAPYAGLVVARLKSEGEWITTMPPSPVIQLAEISPLDLQIDAPEHLLTRIHVGDQVVARFASIGRTEQARVTRIVPMVQAASRSFKVIVEIPNKDLSIQPGVFAEVEITPGEPSSVAARSNRKSR